VRLFKGIIIIVFRYLEFKLRCARSFDPAPVAIGFPSRRSKVSLTPPAQRFQTCGRWVLAKGKNLTVLFLTRFNLFRSSRSRVIRSEIRREARHHIPGMDQHHTSIPSPRVFIFAI
jgi:hypothetical protein